MPGSIFAQLQRIDNRYIYLLLIMSLMAPFLLPLGLPVPVTQSTRAVYDTIESVPAGSKVLFCWDTTSGVYAELGPQGIAVLQHLVSKSAKIYAVGFANEESQTLVEMQMRPKVDMSGKKYGEDYVNLGFYAGTEVSMAAFASDVQKLVRKDYYGTPVESIPMMKQVSTARDFSLLVLIAGGEQMATYLRQFHAPYKIKFVAGTQAVLYPTWLPYVSSGQVAGLLNGLVAAAEYEILIRKFGVGVASADALSMSHLLIVAFIALGNMGYFYDRSRKGGAK